MLLPLSILLGSFWYLDQQNKQKQVPQPEEPKMKPQPKYTQAAIDLVTEFNEELGARTFRPQAMGDATKALESSALELVPMQVGPSDIRIYRLVPLVWGAEKAIDTIPKARVKGLYVLASLSLALSDPRETELLILLGGKNAVRYANPQSVFAVLASPDPKPVAVVSAPEIPEVPEEPKKKTRKIANGTSAEVKEAFPTPEGTEENV